MQQIMTEKVAHKLTNQTTNNKRKTDRHNICDVVCYYYGYWYDNVEYNIIAVNWFLFPPPQYKLITKESELILYIGGRNRNKTQRLTFITINTVRRPNHAKSTQSATAINKSQLWS